MKINWTRVKRIFDHPISIIVICIAIIIIGLIIGGVKALWLSPEKVGDNPNKPDRIYSNRWDTADQDTNGKQLENNFTDTTTPTYPESSTLKLDITENTIVIPRLQGLIKYEIH